MTNAAYVDIVRQQLPAIPAGHILAEPAARNTAPCIAWACWSIKKEDPSANVVVTPADAVVMDPEEFRRVVKNALAFTAGSDAIVTVCIKPSRPETGYGYVEAAGKAEGEICSVAAFKRNRTWPPPKGISGGGQLPVERRQSSCGTCRPSRSPSAATSLPSPP